jgi:2-methylaconitate cis-trans-isomerase PrpF
VVDVFDDVRATCIDVGNPCVFIQAKDLGVEGTLLPDDIDKDPELMGRLESIRQQAAVKMGIASSRDATPGSIPKIAMVSPPSTHVLLSGEIMDEKRVDLVVRALSVGQPHRAVPITVALSIAAAAKVEGSTVHAVVDGEREAVDKDGITLGHSSGMIVVGSKWDEETGDLREAKVFRTARRLMDGWVYWK